MLGGLLSTHVSASQGARLNCFNGIKPLGNYITRFTSMLGDLGLDCSSTKEADCRLSQFTEQTRGILIGVKPDLAEGLLNHSAHAAASSVLRRNASLLERSGLQAQGYRYRQGLMGQELLLLAHTQTCSAVHQLVYHTPGFTVMDVQWAAEGGVGSA